MKRALVLIGLSWLAILAGMVLMKEFTLRTGQDILLKTVPVDPRDLFRGDYVVLAYEISTLDLTQLPADRSSFAPGDRVYVAVVPHGRYHVAARVDSQPPEGQGVFLKGQVRSVAGRSLRMEYGIESYFVPEGKGRVLEQARGTHLDVKASVDRFGHAVIKGLLLEGKEVAFK